MESVSNGYIQENFHFYNDVKLMFMVACASAENKESTGEFIDDTVITTKVKAALLDQVGLKSFRDQC